MIGSVMSRRGKVRFEVVDSAGLTPYIAGLRALEASISYPIADGQDSFSIDHSAAYHPFFTNMGKARFLIALVGDEVIGSMVGVWRPASLAGKSFTGLYICDLKLAAAWRGTGLVRKMLWHILLRWPLRRDFQGWQFVFFAAMRGEKGDVVRSFQGWHLGRLLQPLSRLAVYFVEPTHLSSLEDEGPVAPKCQALNLSPDNFLDWHSTTGRKDFVLHSSGLPWELVHLPRSPLQVDSWARYLQSGSAHLLVEQQNTLICFAVDERLESHTQWLAGHGIERGATCLVYGFSIPFFGPSLKRSALTHLATSEI